MKEISCTPAQTSESNLISGHARLAGIAGWPVAHSRSPQLHNFWLRRHGIDGAYVPFPVRAKDLGRALRALPLLGISGMNLTLPHKQAALEILDHVEPVAQRIGAVNTVWVDSDGQLHGTNTDAFGFWQALIAAYPAWQAAHSPALVVGAGGAARAVIVALQQAGIPEIHLVNRTAEKAETLCAALQQHAPMIPLRCHPWAARNDLVGDVALIVNTTNLGMAGQSPLPLSLAAAPATALVYDIVYVPLETPLLREAKARGLAGLDGLGMLLHQARAGFARWFGVQPTVDAELRQHVLGDLT